MAALDDVRSRIRAIDDQIARLIGERVAAADEAGRVKREHHLPIRDYDTERLVVEFFRTEDDSCSPLHVRRRGSDVAAARRPADVGSALDQHPATARLTESDHGSRRELHGTGDPPAVDEGAEEARRDDARVVQDEGVVRTQVFDEITEDAVFDASGRPVDHHEARSVPRRDGVLGNQLRRERVVEVRELHNTTAGPSLSRF